MPTIFIRHAALAAALVLCGAAPAQTPAAKPTRPTVVALMAAVGDRIEVVRQVESVGSNIEPYSRQRVQVNGQALNFAVLRGLDRALEEEEPQTQRVLLQWTMPAETTQALDAAFGSSRETLVLDALKHHLQSLPERAQWDRIEVIVPDYSFSEKGGMGRKLSGIGIYVQPLATMKLDFSESGSLAVIDGQERDGNYRTINPNTGETGKSSTYVAPFMYFQRVVFDAKSLAVLERKRHFDNTKYADPTSPAQDILKQMPLTQLLGKLLETVERSTYQSVRGVQTEVTVTAPVALPAASAPR